LYGSENLARVNIPAYVTKLCAHLKHACGGDSGLIQLESRASGVELGLDQAVPCGLIINELVSNALKHAFPGGRAGRIRVELQAADQSVTLTVADDGIGLPDGDEVRQPKTLGLKIVAGLAAQLGAALTVTRQPGTVWQLTFPIPSE
jgi:two-component sensor histidine kinase